MIGRIKKYFGVMLLSLFVALVSLAPAASAADSINDLLTPFYDPNAAASGGCSMSGSVALLMEAIAIHESGGDPTAQNPGSTASGKYQMIDSTWQGLANLYYPPAAQYGRAYQAPENVQDAVAYLAFASQASKNYNAFQIAMGWYGGSGVVNNIAANFNIVPPGNTQTYGQYANEIVRFMQAGVAENAIATAEGDSPRYSNRPLSTIPVLAQNAPDFTTYLAKLGSIPPINVATYNSDGSQGSGSSISSSSSCSGTPAGNFVFYNQGDPKWAQHGVYTGNLCAGLPDTIACAGCGPTSAAMVIATLSNNSITPVQTGDYMTSLGSGNGYTSDGATVSGLEQAVEHWGLSASSLGAADYAAARQVLQNGGLIIAGGAGLSPFSGGGHVVVIRGVDSSGNFLIGNPAPSLQTSQDETFSPQALQAAGLIYMIGVTK